MMSKNYKNLLNAMFSVKGRYPDAIITLSEDNNDVSVYYRKGSDRYQIDIIEEEENPQVYIIMISLDGDFIAKYGDYDIRKFHEVEHLHIKLVKILSEDI